MYRLFEQYAHLYDLHTPPAHYKHDHAFVLSEALRIAPTGGRLLDIGCGTGVFVEAALAAGLDAYGLDAAPGMVAAAAARLGANRVRLERMQDLSERSRYDVICALSWVIHYCVTPAELSDTVFHCCQAVRPGGILLLQA